MKYKVLLKQCSDPQRAQRIAREIARWSGASPDVILDAIVRKPVCIRKEAKEAEALWLKRQLEPLGAEVELVALEKTMAAQPAATMPDDDDEESDADARVLSDAEYAQILRTRGDIFRIEKDVLLRKTVSACLLVGLCTGMYMSTIKIVQVATDFIEIPPPVVRAILGKPVADGVLDRPKPQDRKIRQKEFPSDETNLNKKPKNPGSGGKASGGGDPRERVTRQGVLGLIADKITGKALAGGDIFGKGGFQSGLDGIILGVGGLKSGGSAGAGRRGVAGIGFGRGYGSGVGGDGTAAIGDAIDGLFNNEGGNILSLVKRPGKLEISEPRLATIGAAIVGGRSRASIMRVVMQNIQALRYAYNKRLREKPALKGKITCKFAIDEFGKVIFCELLETTMADPDLEAEVKDKISRWVFEKIDKPGDVTEVQYPFVFSQ
jgi:hypothetical protein